MSKIFYKVFPLFDQLYIFQLLEYNWQDYLKWFIKYPLKRNLQRKHSLVLTQKALLLILLSSIFILLISIEIMTKIFSPFWLIPIFFLILTQLSSIFLLVAQLFLFPFEFIKKIEIINAAKEKLDRLQNLKIIGIVGSYAKTSTKDILYTLLWKDFLVVKTPKSFNTKLSIARCVLLDIKSNTEVFIVEMDAYHPGEIKKLAEIIKPNMAILTSIAPQHLERFGSMEKLAKTQFEIADVLPEDGILFLNADSEWINKLQKNYSVKKIFYGKTKESEIYATNINQTISGTKFTLNTKKGSIEVEIPLFGDHHVTNFLAAVCVALNLGLSLDKVRDRAKLLLPTEHRLEIKKMGQITLIDNSYNTNPEVVKSSLKLLKGFETDQRIIITSGLVEQGKNSAKENIKMGNMIAGVADYVIIVGNNAKAPLLKGLKDRDFSSDHIHEVSSTKEGLSLLKEISKPNAVVLLENDLPDQYI